MGLALLSGPALAQPRLAIWITPSFAATDAAACRLSPAALEQVGGSPTLTEQDVVHWEAKTARMRLDPARFGRADAGKLADHCFVLALDGKKISSGVVLRSYSARLVRLPALSVIEHEKFLELRLQAEFTGVHNPPLLLRDELDEILRAALWQRRSAHERGKEQNPCSRPGMICDTF